MLGVGCWCMKLGVQPPAVFRLMIGLLPSDKSNFLGFGEAGGGDRDVVLVLPTGGGEPCVPLEKFERMESRRCPFSATVFGK